jgi:CubicO group peptidase (beta-lactamase class C family)
MPTYFAAGVDAPEVNMRWSFLLSCAVALAAAGHLPKHQGYKCQQLGHLVYGTPESVGLLSKPLEIAVANITNYTHAANYSDYSYDEIHPIEPGSANIVGRCSTIISEWADGKRDLYADVNGTLLPLDEQEDATVDTIYDMASLTKLFTTVAALQQLDAGTIDLQATVASYIPEFAIHGKENITILMLLTHTSGFAPDPVPPLYYPIYKTYAQRLNAIITQKLENPPGSTYLYSDLNFMTMFLVLERITGKKLDQLIAAYTEPLGMTSTFFNRNNLYPPQFPQATYDRMATQEFQIAVLGPKEPKRPQPVRGTVHDENAWSLHGVSGHAGLFSTVGDTAIFCQMILNNGTYGGRRYLSQDAVDMIFHNYNKRFPGDNHGLGFELNQYYTAGPMAGPETASHTGYTGTTLVIDRPSNTFFLHFANRVHPSRDWSSNNIVREALGYWVARSLGRHPHFPSLESS